MIARLASMWLHVRALVDEDAAALLAHRARSRALYAQYCAARGR